MPELGPLLEQGVTSVYTDDHNTETVTTAVTAGDIGVSTVSLVTTRTPDTGNMSTSAPVVISTNIDTIITTTHLNSVDISVTTISPLPTTTMQDKFSPKSETNDYADYVDRTTEAYQEAAQDDALNIDENLINDDDESDSIPIQSNFNVTPPSPSGISDVSSSTSMRSTTSSSQVSDIDDEILIAQSKESDDNINQRNMEQEGVSEDNVQQNIDVPVPLINVNDLIPELQDQEMFQYYHNNTRQHNFKQLSFDKWSRIIFEH